MKTAYTYRASSTSLYSATVARIILNLILCRMRTYFDGEKLPQTRKLQFVGASFFPMKIKSITSCLNCVLNFDSANFCPHKIVIFRPKHKCLPRPWKYFCIIYGMLLRACVERQRDRQGGGTDMLVSVTTAWKGIIQELHSLHVHRTPQPKYISHLYARPMHDMIIDTDHP